jgi:hypothetical protein
LQIRYVGFDIIFRRTCMSALKLDIVEERVRAEEAVEIIDCGRASERTKGSPFVSTGTEGGFPPFLWIWAF